MAALDVGWGASEQFWKSDLVPFGNDVTNALGPGLSWISAGCTKSASAILSAATTGFKEPWMRPRHALSLVVWFALLDQKTCSNSRALGEWFPYV